MQTAIMTIFQFTPEEVVEIRVGVGREEVMRRSGRISGDEGCVCCKMRIVVCFQCDCDLGVSGKACKSDNQHPKDKTRMRTQFLNSHNENTNTSDKKQPHSQSRSVLICCGVCSIIASTLMYPFCGSCTALYNLSYSAEI